MDDEVTSTEQIRILTERLAEAEETLRAVRSGEIDAFIVQGAEGEQVYALRSAEQPYRNLVEDMLEGAAILTTDGDIAYCNRRFAELVGMPLEEVVGGSMERYIHKEERVAYRSLLAAGSGKRRTQLTTADGRTIDVFVSFTTSMCDEVERRNLIITDLSELVDAQSGRDRAEQQSQAKDEFMAMLAHELRNPLSAITAAVQVLEAAGVGGASGAAGTAAAGVAAAGTGAAAAGGAGATSGAGLGAASGRAAGGAGTGAAARARFIIGRQVQHLARLVDDLLDVGRAVTGKIVLDKRVIDFCDVVRRTAAVFTEREVQHRFEVSCCSSLSIEGDPVRIEQIVSNIIGNAVKYTPSGGKISISLLSEGEDAVLTVKDSGFGITPELLPRIFELFVQGERTLDRAQGGLGIGLTLVRRLVNLHDGTVSAFSDGPGLGSVFTVRLPRVAVATGHDAGTAAACGRGCPVIHRRVLIVEDNRDAREMFRTMLELDGHDVFEAEEGFAGLQMLRTAMPDVAFIDVGLPGLDGYEIARRFRGDGGSSTGSSASLGSPPPRVLLVALTGYGTPDALERSRCAGFDVHLIKPVNPEALYKLLNTDQNAADDAHASSAATLRVAAPAGRLYNERLSWCGVEQSGSSSGS